MVAFIAASATLIVFLFLLTISPWSDNAASLDPHYLLSDLRVALDKAFHRPVGTHIVVLAAIGGAAAVVIPFDDETWDHPGRMALQVCLLTIGFSMIVPLVLTVALGLQVLTAVAMLVHPAPAGNYVLPKQICNARELAKATFQLYQSASPAHVAIAVVGPAKPDAQFKRSLAKIARLVSDGRDYSDSVMHWRRDDGWLPELDLLNAHPEASGPPDERGKIDVVRVLFLQGTQFVRGRNTSVWADGLTFSGIRSHYEDEVERAIDRETPRGLPLIAVGHSLGGMVARRIKGPNLVITFGSPFGEYYSDQLPYRAEVSRAFAVKGDIVPLMDKLQVLNAATRHAVRSLQKDSWVEMVGEIAALSEMGTTNQVTWLPNQNTFFRALISPRATHMQYPDNRALEKFDVFGKPMSGRPDDCLWFAGDHPI